MTDNCQPKLGSADRGVSVDGGRPGVRCDSPASLTIKQLCISRSLRLQCTENNKHIFHRHMAFAFCISARSPACWSRSLLLRTCLAILVWLSKLTLVCCAFARRVRCMIVFGQSWLFEVKEGQGFGLGSILFLFSAVTHFWPDLT